MTTPCSLERASGCLCSVSHCIYHLVFTEACSFLECMCSLMWDGIAQCELDWVTSEEQGEAHKGEKAFLASMIELGDSNGQLHLPSMQISSCNCYWDILVQELDYHNYKNVMSV